MSKKLCIICLGYLLFFSSFVAKAATIHIYPESHTHSQCFAQTVTLLNKVLKKDNEQDIIAFEGKILDLEHGYQVYTPFTLDKFWDDYQNHPAFDQKNNINPTFDHANIFNQSRVFGLEEDHSYTYTVIAGLRIKFLEVYLYANRESKEFSDFMHFQNLIIKYPELYKIIYKGYYFYADAYMRLIHYLDRHSIKREQLDLDFNTLQKIFDDYQARQTLNAEKIMADYQVIKRFFTSIPENIQKQLSSTTFLDYTVNLADFTDPLPEYLNKELRGFKQLHRQQKFSPTLSSEFLNLYLQKHHIGIRIRNRMWISTIHKILEEKPSSDNLHLHLSIGGNHVNDLKKLLTDHELNFIIEEKCY